MGCTRGSDFVFTTDDVLEMIVVCGVGVVGGVCEMCMCLAPGRRCVDEWMRGFGLGFTNPVGTRGVWDVCLCLNCGGVDGVGGVGMWLCPGYLRVG